MADTANSQAEEQGIRPLVARPVSNRGVWIFGGVLAAAAAGLFYSLQVRRLDLENPSLTAPQTETVGMIASPPELQIPAGAGYASSYPYGMPPPARGFGDTGPIAVTRLAPRPVQGDSGSAYAPSYSPVSQQPSYPAYAGPPVPAMAYQAPVNEGTGTGANQTTTSGRVQAGRLANPGTTVPQGTVIQAVMETALDSTRAGFARALVSRDVTSFDGTRVLIPKGSKLFGDYASDVSLGQKRALIQWHRLTRPDGAIIDINSPSADPLGRAGVKGKVNTHFIQRFSGAILQSVLDIGVRAATREVGGDTVVVALPNSTQNAATIQRPDDIKPTLKVAQGSSVSVFVGRDLDFTSVEP